MEKTESKLEFGLSRAVPGHVQAAWGARAIYVDPIRTSRRVSPKGVRDKHFQPRFDLVWDRQSTFGAEEERKRLQVFLDQFLQKANEEFGRAFLDKGSRETETLIDNPQGTIVCSCNGSHGYVYLAAWLKG
jgi:hypothetical protein